MIQRSGDSSSSGASTVLNIAMPILVFGAGIGIFVAMMAFKKAPAKAKADDEIQSVSTSVATSYSGNMEIAVSGLVVPYREIAITAQVDGIVLEKTDACEAGRQVTKGTPLLTIDPESYDLEVKRLTAEGAQAAGALQELAVEIKTTENKIELAKKQVELRARELDRFLNIGDTGARSGRDLDLAEWNKLSADIELVTQQDRLELLTTSKSRLESAEQLVLSQLARAELDLRRCNMVAPVDGVIVFEQVEEQAYVTRGTKLVLFEDTSKAEVECNLRIDQLETILVNATQPLADYELPRTEVFVDYESSRGTVSWRGYLARTNGIGLDEKTRTMPCLIEVEEPINENSVGIRTLVRGMFVNARIQVPSTQPLVRLPAESLQGKDSVWVVQDGKLQKAEVTRVSISELDQTAGFADGYEQQFIVVQQIDGLLEPGSKVVTSPVTYETEGQPVRESTKSKVELPVTTSTSSKAGGEIQ